MKVLIISPCTLPVPAVHGGAVQQLIDTIIKENEIEKKVDLSIVGLWDKDSSLESIKYKHTKFIFWKEPKICKVLDYIYEKIFYLLTFKKNKILKLPTRKLFVISKLKRFLLNEEYDVVVFENMGYQLAVFKEYNLCLKLKGKCWFHLHNEIPNSVKREFLEYINLMSISSYLIEDVNKKYENNLLMSKIVKNGIDYEKFSRLVPKKELDELKSKLNISDEEKVIIFVGRIIPEKGIEKVIDAFIKLKNYKVKLVIVGSLNFGLKRTSDFEKRLSEKCKNISDKIVFTGFVPQNEIHKYYKLANVAVLPSIWNEPAGLTMLEAAASGVAVITTKVGGIPEYLNNEYSIFLDNNLNLVDNLVVSIEDVLNNPLKWEDNIKKQQKYVKENFSEINYYKNFIKTLGIDY